MRRPAGRQVQASCVEKTAPPAWRKNGVPADHRGDGVRRCGRVGGDRLSGRGRGKHRPRRASRAKFADRRPSNPKRRGLLVANAYTCKATVA